MQPNIAVRNCKASLYIQWICSWRSSWTSTQAMLLQIYSMRLLWQNKTCCLFVTAPTTTIKTLSWFSISSMNGIIEVCHWTQKIRIRLLISKPILYYWCQVSNLGKYTLLLPQILIYLICNTVYWSYCTGHRPVWEAGFEHYHSMCKNGKYTFPQNEPHKGHLLEVLVLFHFFINTVLDRLWLEPQGSGACSRGSIISQGLIWGQSTGEAHGRYVSHYPEPNGLTTPNDMGLNL